MMAMTLYVSLSPNRSSHGHNECNPVAEKPFSSDLKLSGSELKMIELSPCVMLCQCLKSFTDGSLFLPNRRIPEHSRHVWASGHRYQQRRHQQWKELGEDHTSQPGKMMKWGLSVTFIYTAQNNPRFVAAQSPRLLGLPACQTCRRNHIYLNWIWTHLSGQWPSSSVSLARKKRSDVCNSLHAAAKLAQWFITGRFLEFIWILWIAAISFIKEGMSVLQIACRW